MVAPRARAGWLEQVGARPHSTMSSGRAGTPPRKRSRGAEPSTIEDFGFTKRGRATAQASDSRSRTKLQFADDEASSNSAKKKRPRVVSAYVPEAIHRVVGYAREGATKALCPSKRALFTWCETNCAVPEDFESDHTFGPKSGICHEERVISAFVHELLPLKPSATTAIMETGKRWRQAVLDGDIAGAAKLAL